jgi:hypothetical protein
MLIGGRVHFAELHEVVAREGVGRHVEYAGEVDTPEVKAMQSSDHVKRANEFHAAALLAAAFGDRLLNRHAVGDEGDHLPRPQVPPGRDCEHQRE